MSFSTSQGCGIPLALIPSDGNGMAGTACFLASQSGANAIVRGQRNK
jgi:hypothetical protein